MTQSGLTVNQAPAPAQQAPTAQPRRLVFAVVSVGVVMSNLDMMIVNVAFPEIQADFGDAPAAGLSWTLTAYSIVFAALLVPAGRLADRSGRRAGFLFGLGVFTVASALCAMSQSIPVLVASRVLQAAGAAALVPTSLGILLAAYPLHRRAATVRAWTAVSAVAAAVAPIVGGGLVSLNWRWIFLVNVPFGAAGVLIGRKVLPDPDRDQPGPLPDLGGAILLILGVGGLALGLVKAPEWGWTSGRVAGCLVTAVVLLAAFVLRSAQHPVPVVSLDLLRVRSFAMANLATLAFGACFSAMLFSVVLFCSHWGYSALDVGLALAPGTFLMPIVALSSGRLVRRLGPAVVIAIGCALLTVGVLWWAILAQAEPSLAVLLPGALLTPVGSILAVSTLVTVATRDLPPASLATGSAVNAMTRQIGFVIGVSAFVAALGPPGSGADFVGSFQRGWLIVAVFGICATVLGLALRRERAGQASS
jgi:EmrB/QacA subfamily drug resistance transporter